MANRWHYRVAGSICSLNIYLFEKWSMNDELFRLDNITPYELRPLVLLFKSLIYVFLYRSLGEVGFGKNHLFKRWIFAANFYNSLDRYRTYTLQKYDNNSEIMPKWYQTVDFLTRERESRQQTKSKRHSYIHVDDFIVPLASSFNMSTEQT